ncbi:MAG: hypothetical protein V1907_04385 [Candidatus Kerfeldbacteria bacterium]
MGCLYANTASANSVSGVLTDPLGQPAVNQRVDVYGVTSPLDYGKESTVSAGYAHSDANGRYQIDVGTDTGLYKAVIEPDQVHFVSAGSATLKFPDKRFFSFSEGSTDETNTVNFTMERAGLRSTVKGTVDSLQKKLKKEFVAGHIWIQVELVSDPNFFRTAMVASDGSFSLSLTEGTYRVKALLLNTLSSTWIEFPELSVTLDQGQTVDLGRVSALDSSLTMTRVCMTCMPLVLSSGKNEVLVRERNQRVRTARYVETFSKKNGLDVGGIDTTLSSGVRVRGGYLDFDGTTTMSDGNKVAVSRPFTPPGVMVLSVRLGTDWIPTLQESLQFAISPDGIQWLPIYRDEKTTVPSDWDTTKGLRWRIVGLPSVSNVFINEVQIVYSFTHSATSPKLQNAQLKQNGTVILTGTHFTPDMTYYIGVLPASHAMHMAQKKARLMPNQPGVVFASDVLYRSTTRVLLQKMDLKKGRYYASTMTPELDVTVKRLDIR